MSYHRDSEVSRAIVRLLDTLCTWERNTGNGSKVILVHDNNDDGPTLFAMDGKPVNHSPFETCLHLDIIKNQIMPNWREYQEEL